jgi:competence protein ComEC
MLERVKWLTVMIMIASMLMGAQAVVERFVFPSTLDIEPTGTPTLAPSATLAPTITSTAAKSSPDTGLFIADIVYDPPGNALNGEVVLIENTLESPVDLAGWTLRDDQKNVFTFPAVVLGSGQTVSVWSRTGVDTTSNLYWNLDAEIWNDGGDCGYLRDESGKLQSYICY